MSRRYPIRGDRPRGSPDHRPPEPTTDWHDQDWLLILDALEQYARDRSLTDGQELRVYQLVESIARHQGTVSLGAVQRLDVAHFDQYSRSD